MTPEAESERPPVLTLRYRSVGAFLVAYSAHLAKGEVFVETEAPWPAGSRAALRLQPPGAPPLDLDATVAAVHPEPLGPGQPAGMTLALSPSIEAYGAVIDDLAARFQRIRILLGTGEPAPRAIISRYLRSILSCDLAEVTFQREGTGSIKLRPEVTANGAAASARPGAPAADETGGHGPVDLAVIDLDSSGLAGADLVTSLRTSVANSELPIIVLAQLERDRLRGVALGADEALTNPPLFGELQSAVIHGLSRPQISSG